jgi:hypothetical protein
LMFPFQGAWQVYDANAEAKFQYFSPFVMLLFNVDVLFL